MTSDKLLTARQAMAILGCCRSFLTKYAAELGAVRVGTRLRFEQASLDAYIAHRRVTEPVQAAPAPTPIRRPAALTKHRHATNPVTRQPWSASGGR